MNMRVLFLTFSMLMFLCLTAVSLAGDPSVLRFVNPRINYSILDSVYFEVEVENVYGFPASQYSSYFLITPIGDPTSAERFDIPEFTFPAMANMNVGMFPQFWQPKQDGPHRVEFFSDSPDDIDTSNNYALWDFYVAYQNPLLDRSSVSALVNQYIALNLQLDSLTDVAMVAQTPLHGTRITSRDSTEFDMTLDSTMWFAWIERNKYARFAKDNWFVVVDRADSTLSAYHTNWSPASDGLSYPFMIGGRKDADIVYGSPVQPEFVPTLELISEVDTSSRQPRSCAILVTGGEDTGTAFDDAFDNDINTMRNNLTLEKLGPRIHPDDVIVLRNPSPEEVREELLKLKGKCSNVYFVYSGHGGRWSMALRESYFYTDFLADLDAVGADSASILIDACHSGALIDALDTLKGVLENTHVTAVTACAPDTLSYSSKLITGTGDTITLSTYAWAFAKCFGNPDADIDGVPGTSFKETYLWINVVDPLLAWSGTPLAYAMRPQLRVRPRKAVDTLLNRNAAAKIAQDWMRAQPGVDSTLSSGYLLQQPLHGVHVTGRDSSNYSTTLDSLYWFGWLDGNIYGSFGKPATYFTINRLTGALLPDTTDWYPSLDNIPYPGTMSYPASHDMIFGGPRYALPVPTFNTIAEADTTSPGNGKSCAVFISGGDYMDHLWTNRFNRGADLMMNEQLRELRGLRVDTANVLRLSNPTPTQLRTGLGTLNGPYERVFFYYGGNGRADAMQVRMPFAYNELVQQLSTIDTKEIEIVIDAPSSGSIIGDLLNSASLREGVKWTVATSSAVGEPAFGEMVVNPAGDSLALPSFTYAFSRRHGAVETDIDSMHGTSVAETILSILSRNEKPGWSNQSLRQLQQPQLYIDGVVNPINDVLRISDISMQFDFTTLPDPGASLRYRMRPLDTDFPRDDSILYISPGRMWTFNLGDNGLSFEVNMSFNLLPGLDSMRPPQHTRLGVVRRDSLGRPWSIVRSGFPEWNASRIQARAINRFSDWAIAYVRNNTPSHASATLSTVENVESPPVIPTVIDGDVGDTFVFTLLTQPMNGTARIDGNALRYMPGAGFAGSDSFTFRATDEAGDWVDGIATVNVQGGNKVPAFFARTSPVDGSSVIGDAVELRWSASTDADGDPLRYIVQLSSDGRNHEWETSDSSRRVTRAELGLANGIFSVRWQVLCTDGVDTTAAANGEGQFTFDNGTDVETPLAAASGILLLDHHPEPFRDAASIHFSLGEEYSVRISIHSLTGQQLSVITDGRLGPGVHTASWNGSDADGRPLPSGVYVAMLSVHGHPPLIRRLTLLR